MIIDQRMAKLADHMLRSIARGEFRGDIGRMIQREGQRHTPSGDGYRGAYHHDDAATGTRVVVSLDVGHHAGGWFRNPDYERCIHLSLSFRDTESGEFRSRDESLSEAWCRAFFGDDCRYLWVESPKTDSGRICDVWHYRIFCDAHWQPIIPRGEVYSRELTEVGWKSWTELRDERERREAAR